METSLRFGSLLSLLLLGACPMMDDDDESSTSTAAVSSEESSSSTADPTTSPGSSDGCGDPGSVAGVVRRTAVLGADGDGVGTLFVAAFGQCDLTTPVLGVFVLPMADLAADDAEIPFAIEGLPAGTVHLAAFLDDDGNADPMAPLPDEGDPVLADDVGDGMLTCVAANVGDDALVLELNAIEAEAP